MSETRIFYIGTAEIFQDKPSSETRRMMELVHKKQQERVKRFELLEELSENLSKTDESELNSFINVLIRKVKTKKQKNGKEK